MAHTPESWRFLLWAGANQAWIWGGALSFIVSLIRTFIDNEAFRKKDFADAAMCMLIVAVSRPFAVKYGLGDEWAFPYGLAVGYVGAAYLKPFIVGFFKAYKDVVRGEKK